MADWDEIKGLFHEALDLSAAERSSFLEQSCHGDAETRHKVESLLLAHERAGDFIVEPALVEAGLAAGDGEAAAATEASFTGRLVGPYEIQRELGRGGMGAVLLAVRADAEFEKQVAIKVIKRGMDTESILRRFVMERQILANLEHENIARFLDGGTTDDGLPYFVMEYVEGEPITTYCDANELNTSARLLLFQRVCAAVQYAHQNLVVHRDLKPGNILVTRDGTPKLLDFGVAKLLNPDWTSETTEQTASAWRLMTPEYASPEQLRGLPITTATDVYSLGVVLYELLSGQRPFRFRSRLPEEIVRVLLTEEPERPSEAVTRREGAAATRPQSIPQSAAPGSAVGQAGARGGCNPKTLRGDLDNIVLKALRKDRERRYASVQEFSEDIRRHLEGLPVKARPDTFSYRAGKFVQRHKAGAVAAAIMVATLLTATVATTWQARVARHERDKAERRFNQVRKLAHLVVFDYHDQIAKLPGSTPVREKMIKDAIEYLDNLSADSHNDATLQRELAAAYEKVGDVQGNPYFSNLGDQEGALASYRKALNIREDLDKQNPADAATRYELGTGYKNIGDILWGKGENKESLANYQKALTIFSELANADRKNLKSRNGMSIALNGIGHVQEQMGDSKGALDSYTKMLANDETLVAAEPGNKEYQQGTAVAYLKLGDALRQLGDVKASLESYEKSVATFSELSAADKNNAPLLRTLAIVQGRVANTYGKLKQYDAAIDSHKKTIALQNQIAAADTQNIQARFDIATTYENLGDLFRVMKRFDDAAANVREAITILNEALKKDPGLTQSRGHLGVAYQTLGEILAQKHDASGAFTNYREALAVLEVEPVRSSKKIDLASCYEDIGDLQSAKKDWQSARQSYEKSLVLWRELEAKGALAEEDKNEPNDIVKKIAKCDAALKK